MRILGLLLGIHLGLSAVGSAAAMDIVDVLERSQQVRLDLRVPAPADSERTARVRASFDKLLALAPPPHPVELRVLEGGVQAEAMLGHLLVVGDAVGDLPEGERLMLLGHEYAHLALDHWHALTSLYRRHIPGDVRPETTDPVAGALGRDAHQLSYKHEFEADAFGFRIAQQLGASLDEAMSLLTRQPISHDTATHPATRRRLAQLRMLESRREEQARLTADSPVPVLAGAALPAR